MHVTTRFSPRVHDVSASPDRCYWSKISKRPLISAIDPLIWSWPLIAKWCQSDSQDDFVCTIIKTKTLALLSSSLHILAFRNQTQSLSPKIFQIPLLPYFQNPSDFLPPPNLRGFFTLVWGLWWQSEKFLGFQATVQRITHSLSTNFLFSHLFLLKGRSSLTSLSLNFFFFDLILYFHAFIFLFALDC